MPVASRLLCRRVQHLLLTVPRAISGAGGFDQRHHVMGIKLAMLRKLPVRAWHAPAGRYAQSASPDADTLPRPSNGRRLSNLCSCQGLHTTPPRTFRGRTETGPGTICSIRRSGNILKSTGVDQGPLAECTACASYRTTLPAGNLCGFLAVPSGVTRSWQLPFNCNAAEARVRACQRVAVQANHAKYCCTAALWIEQGSERSIAHHK